KLLELNNLHSLMSVVSALQSAPIFRLSKTWALLSRKDKTTFDKLDYLVSKEDNCKRMREHIRSLKMVPCIPYLGIYLLDIIYIDSAYPASGSILENEQRTNQMNNILRIIADLQVSCKYDHLITFPHVQKYLKSVRYIEELQKFVEDDNYKLSLRIEPGNSSPRLVSSKEDLAGPSEVTATVRFSRRPTCPDASVATNLPTPPVSRHRKSHSLGNNVMCQFTVVESKSATFPSEKQRHLLDDSVLESQSPVRNRTPVFTNGMSLGSSESSEFSEDVSAVFDRGRLYATLGPNCRVPVRNSPRSRSCVYSSTRSERASAWIQTGMATVRPTGAYSSFMGNSSGVIAMEGPIRRKTLLKEGKKPTYWVTLYRITSTLLWAKVLRGSERKHTGSRFHAILWHKHLDDACKSTRPLVPTNLMSFE
ncbi:hypothetical protein GDO86_014827, partial [Hymenochirus boettgeri]